MSGVSPRPSTGKAPVSVVMKFGGTSVADEPAFRRVTAIVKSQLARQSQTERPPVVVVSALSKVTDGLLQVARLSFLCKLIMLVRSNAG